jgi:hypothetical protein
MEPASANPLQSLAGASIVRMDLAGSIEPA